MHRYPILQNTPGFQSTALLFLLLLLLCPPTADANKFQDVGVGDMAPDFSLLTLSGEPVQLQAERGKVVLLSFWATWCGPCRLELPHFEDLQKEFGLDDFSVIAVSADTRKHDIEKFSDELKLKLPLLYDPGLKVNQSYRIQAMPMAFILDHSGKIRHIHKGFKEGQLPLYDKEIKALIAEK